MARPTKTNTHLRSMEWDIDAMKITLLYTIPIVLVFAEIMSNLGYHMFDKEMRRVLEPVMLWVLMVAVMVMARLNINLFLGWVCYCKVVMFWPFCNMGWCLMESLTILPLPKVLHKNIIVGGI